MCDIREYINKLKNKINIIKIENEKINILQGNYKLILLRMYICREILTLRKYKDLYENNIIIEELNELYEELNNLMILINEKNNSF